jgi:hypothetical protein
MTGLSFRERLSEGYRLLKSPPSWADIQYVQLDAQMNSSKDEYYSAPGTYVLSRLSLIRADSDLIAACSNGFHYGFKPLKMDLLRNIPRIFYRNKPDVGSELYIEGVIGIDKTSPGHWSYTSTSDSFAAFGWAGVVAFPFFVLPVLFGVFDSMFDIARPWGTVALGIGVLAGGAPMAGTLMLLFKQSLYLWMLSVLTVGIARILTGSGDRRISGRNFWSRGRVPLAGRLS